MDNAYIALELQYCIYYQINCTKPASSFLPESFFTAILDRYFGDDLRSYIIVKNGMTMTISVSTSTPGSFIEFSIEQQSDLDDTESLISNLLHRILAVRLLSIGSSITPEALTQYTSGFCIGFIQTPSIVHRLGYDVNNGIVTISSPEDDSDTWCVRIVLDNTPEQQFYWMYEVLCHMYPELNLKNVNWITFNDISKAAVYSNNNFLAGFYKLVPLLKGASADDKQKYASDWFKTYIDRIMDTQKVVDTSPVETSVDVDDTVKYRVSAKTQRAMFPRLPIRGYPNVEDGAIPRRCFIPLRTVEEHAIYDVMELVERVGASPQLTDCISHLADAANALADWIDHVPRKES